MNFDCAVLEATQRAIDFDLPPSSLLWGNTITAEANMLAGLDSDAIGHAPWH